MKRLLRVRNSCKVPGCKNVRHRSGVNYIRFLTFPKDEARREAWRQFCNISRDVNVTNFQICALHFKNEDFYNNEKKRVLPTAIPTIYNIVPEQNRNEHEYIPANAVYNEGLVEAEIKAEIPGPIFNPLLDHDYCCSFGSNFGKAFPAETPTNDFVRGQGVHDVVNHQVLVEGEDMAENPSEIPNTLLVRSTG